MRKPRALLAGGALGGGRGRVQRATLRSAPAQGAWKTTVRGLVDAVSSSQGGDGVLGGELLLLQVGCFDLLGGSQEGATFQVSHLSLQRTGVAPRGLRASPVNRTSCLAMSIPPTSGSRRVTFRVPLPGLSPVTKAFSHRAQTATSAILGERLRADQGLRKFVHGSGGLALLLGEISEFHGDFTLNRSPD